MEDNTNDNDYSRAANVELRSIANLLNGLFSQLDRISNERIFLNADDKVITDLRHALRDMEDITEDLRRDYVEEELDSRMDKGEILNGLKRLERRVRVITDEDQVYDTLEKEDLRQVTTLRPKKVEKVMDEMVERDPEVRYEDRRRE